MLVAFQLGWFSAPTVDRCFIPFIGFLLLGADNHALQRKSAGKRRSLAMKAIANHVFALNFPHATLQSKRGGARNVLAAAKRRSCTVAVFAGHACAPDLASLVQK